MALGIMRSIISMVLLGVAWSHCMSLRSHRVNSTNILLHADTYPGLVYNGVTSSDWEYE
jgi:hypothetical protein